MMQLEKTRLKTTRKKRQKILVVNAKPGRFVVASHACLFPYPSTQSEIVYSSCTLGASLGIGNHESQVRLISQWIRHLIAYFASFCPVNSKSAWSTEMNFARRLWIFSPLLPVMCWWCLIDTFRTCQI